MSRWTDEELHELVTLWPTNSASQIAKRLHRQRSAMAKRLRLEGLLRIEVVYEKVFSHNNLPFGWRRWVSDLGPRGARTRHPSKFSHLSAR